MEKDIKNSFKKLGEYWEDKICTWRKIPDLKSMEISRTRIRVAAAIFDNENKVSLNYYGGGREAGYQSSLHAFPGGGVDDDESLEEALRREIREEVGVDINNIEKLGYFIEHRMDNGDKKRIIQENYFFRANVYGMKKKRKLTESEKKSDLKNSWFKVSDLKNKFENESHDFHRLEGLKIIREIRTKISR